MTFRTYTKKGMFFHAVYIAVLTVSGILAVYSAVFGALHIGCKEDKIALGFTVFFALLIISVDFFEYITTLKSSKSISNMSIISQLVYG